MHLYSAPSLKGVAAGRVVELKFVGGPGGALLGVNSDGPVVCVNVLWRLRLPEGLGLLAVLEEELMAIGMFIGGGRPHWGKLHGLREQVMMLVGESPESASPSVG